MKRTVAFVTYETIYAPCGGVQAVMRYLPRHLQEVSGWSTVLITPYHHRIAATTRLDLEHLATVSVPFGRRRIGIRILRLAGEVPVHFLQPDDERFFAGRRHPYDVETAGRGSDAVLLRDSLLFGLAVREALPVLSRGGRFRLMLQDWEAATTALALAGRRTRHECVLTLHNSYDCGLPGHLLRRAGIPPAACPGSTVLRRALKVVGETVFTVSDQFARDLVTDPLQRDVMAPHLQRLLARRLVGVCNGPFVEPGIDEDLLREAAEGRHRRLSRWKASRKREALKALRRVVPSPDRPVWGDPRRLMASDAPWFVFAGRDDTRQKGYDVAVAAIRRFLKRERDAKFLFFPIPGDEGLPGLDFLRRLCTDRPDNVLAFPFLWKEGFGAALSGAAYGVMPSLYEPFGMASEFYLQGTVGIARATGGLVQQIRPRRDVPSCGPAAVAPAERWHAADAPPTGFLYRESPGPADREDWIRINEAGYLRRRAGNRVTERGGLALFRRMAGALEGALSDAREAYRDGPGYYRMLAEGVRFLRSDFGWDRAAREYLARGR